MAYLREKDYVDKLRENLTCGLCLDVFDNEEKLPRVIDCQHSFCSSCLQRLLSLNSRYQIPCPVCRESFRVPRQGVSGLAVNRALKNLVDVLHEEEKVAERKNKRQCTRHVAQYIVMACRTCRVELCAVCLKTGNHTQHEVQDVETATQEVERFIADSLLPEMSELLVLYDQRVRTTHEELGAWHDKTTALIEGRALILVAQITEWRERNKRIVRDILERTDDDLRCKFETEHVEAVRQEVRVKQQPSFSRLGELEEMKREIESLLEQQVQVHVPEIKLSDRVRVHLEDVIIQNKGTTPQSPAAIHLELLSSCTLMEQSWMDSHPLHVYDSSSGANSDVVLVTGSHLLKYELLNHKFRQVWQKPIMTSRSSTTTGGAMCRVFVTARRGDVVVRRYPSTVQYDAYLVAEHEYRGGDYGQLVGAADDRLLYWRKPAVHVYTLPGHHPLCELRGGGGGGGGDGGAEGAVGGVEGAVGGARSKQEDSIGAVGGARGAVGGARNRNEDSIGAVGGARGAVGGARSRNTDSIGEQWSWVAVCVCPATKNMAVVDWHTKSLTTFAHDGSHLSSTPLSFAPAPYKSCVASPNHLFITEYAGRGLHVFSWGADGVQGEIGRLSGEALGLGASEEIAGCLGWADGVLTLMVNGNGVKRLVAYQEKLLEGTGEL